MSTYERETILVLIDVVNGNLPAVAVVAEFAFGAVFATMQIGVAILAFYRSIAENEVLVAVGALHFRVPAAQRKLRARMIKLKLGAQRLPALRGVTLLAINVELIAVGAMKGSIERDVLSERDGPPG